MATQNEYLVPGEGLVASINTAVSPKQWMTPDGFYIDEATTGGGGGGSSTSQVIMGGS